MDIIPQSGEYNGHLKVEKSMDVGAQSIECGYQSSNWTTRWTSELQVTQSMYLRVQNTAENYGHLKVENRWKPQREEID